MDPLEAHASYGQEFMPPNPPPYVAETARPMIVYPDPITSDGKIDIPIIRRFPRPSTPPAETISTLQQKLASKATDSGTAKVPANFNFITQSDVDDWNEFMLMSAQYHYIGFGEQARLKAYMGDINKEFIRSIKGERPQTPEVTFRKDFDALRLQPAVDWNEYYVKCTELAKAVRNKIKATMQLRLKALKSPAALRSRERGLFADKDWSTHEDQVSGHFRAWTEAENLELLIEKSMGMWQEEKRLYEEDPKAYKWKDPSRLFRSIDVRSEEEKQDGIMHRKLIRMPDPREKKPKECLETDDEWAAAMKKVKEVRKKQTSRPELVEVRVPLAAPDSPPWSPPPGGW